MARLPSHKRPRFYTTWTHLGHRVYGKAGWVWGKFDFLSTDTFSGGGFNGGPRLITDAASDTLNGLLLGVGIEHALTNNWTVKLEYKLFEVRFEGTFLHYLR